MKKKVTKQLLVEFFTKNLDRVYEELGGDDELEGLYFTDEELDNPNLSFLFESKNKSMKTSKKRLIQIIESVITEVLDAHGIKQLSVDLLRVLNKTSRENQFSDKFIKNAARSLFNAKHTPKLTKMIDTHGHEGTVMQLFNLAKEKNTRRLSGVTGKSVPPVEGGKTDSPGKPAWLASAETRTPEDEERARNKLGSNPSFLKKESTLEEVIHNYPDSERLVPETPETAKLRNRLDKHVASAVASGKEAIDIREAQTRASTRGEQASKLAARQAQAAAEHAKQSNTPRGMANKARSAGQSAVKDLLGDEGVDSINEEEEDINIESIIDGLLGGENKTEGEPE